MIALKFLRVKSGETLKKCIPQTADYMDRCAAAAGHLVTLDCKEEPWAEMVCRRIEEFDGTPIEVWACEAPRFLLGSLGRKHCRCGGTWRCSNTVIQRTAGRAITTMLGSPRQPSITTWLTRTGRHLVGPDNSTR